MKFRAKIEKTTKIVTFSNLAAVIAKLSNETILRLSKKKVYLIQSVSASEEGVLWCDIETKSLFTEYTYQGYVAPGFDEDEIILELSASDLCRALEFGNTDKHCPRDLKMKLSKELPPGKKNQTSKNQTANDTGNPVLAFQIQIEQINSGRMLVVSREIPIKIVSKKFWAEYKEPLMPKFNMSIFMPSLGKVRSMIDKIKNLSKTLIVRASPDGTLQFRTKNAMQKISVNFHNLEKPVWEGDATPNETETSVRIP